MIKLLMTDGQEKQIEGDLNKIIKDVFGSEDTERVKVLFADNPAILIVDELGISKQLPFNANASVIYGNASIRFGLDVVYAPRIVGDAILLTGSDALPFLY